MAAQNGNRRSEPESWRQQIAVWFGRVFRNWLPFGLFFIVLAVIAGWAGHRLGLPYLFRDDPALLHLSRYEYLRSSPAVWGHFGATLLLACIWMGIFVREEELRRVPPMPQERRNGNAKSEDRLSKKSLSFLLFNSWPFLLLLLAAAFFGTPKDQNSLQELMLALLGILLGCIMVLTYWPLRWLFREARQRSDRSREDEQDSVDVEPGQHLFKNFIHWTAGRIHWLLEKNHTSHEDITRRVWVFFVVYCDIIFDFFRSGCGNYSRPVLLFVLFLSYWWDFTISQ